MGRWQREALTEGLMALPFSPLHHRLRRRSPSPSLRDREDHSAAPSPFAAFAFRAFRHEGRFRTAATPSATAGAKGTAGVLSPRASAASIHSR